MKKISNFVLLQLQKDLMEVTTIIFVRITCWYRAELSNQLFLMLNYISDKMKSLAETLHQQEAGIKGSIWLLLFYQQLHVGARFTQKQSLSNILDM